MPSALRDNDISLKTFGWKLIFPTRHHPVSSWVYKWTDLFTDTSYRRTASVLSLFCHSPLLRLSDHYRTTSKCHRAVFRPAFSLDYPKYRASSANGCLVDLQKIVMCQIALSAVPSYCTVYTYYYACHTWALLFTTRRYTNPCLPYLTLPYLTYYLTCGIMFSPAFVCLFVSRVNSRKIYW